MTVSDLEARAGEIAAEETRLRDELREVEDVIHTRLRRDAHANAEKIEQLEKRVRAIVLRLSALERERIELTIASRL